MQALFMEAPSRLTNISRSSALWEVYRMASIRGTATAGSGETMFSGLIFFRSKYRGTAVSR